MTQDVPDRNAGVDLPPTDELVPHVQASAKARGFQLGIAAAQQLIEFLAIAFEAIKLHREAKRADQDKHLAVTIPPLDPPKD